MISWIKKELEDYKYLLRAVPAYTVTLFVLSVVCMNLLANKELFVLTRANGSVLLAMDCGFTISWISFLCMDCICKRWGAKAATKISILAIVTNLGVTIVFNILGNFATGHWGQYYTTLYADGGNETIANIANTAINNTFKGSWAVVLGSAAAMFVSSIVNSLLNTTIGKVTHDNNSFKKFAIRSFISTGVAQWVDNIVFAFLLFKILYPDWTILSLVINATIGAFFELLCEIVLSPIGYKMSLDWAKENVGKDYLDRQSKNVKTI